MTSHGSVPSWSLSGVVVGSLVLLDTALLSFATVLHATVQAIRPRSTAKPSEPQVKPNNQDRLRQVMDTVWTNTGSADSRKAS